VTLDPESWAFKRTKYDDPRVAAEYDARRSRRGWARRWREALHEGTLARAFADVPAGSRVLDLPCGTGVLAPWLLGRGYRVLGADIAGQMLAQARAKQARGELAGPLSLLAADAERLPLADRSVDVALVVRFVHLMPAEVRHRVYRELARVTRDRVVLSVSLDPWAAKHVWKRLRGGGKPYFMTRDQLARDMAPHGLRLERVHQKLRFVSTAWVVVCRPAP
jgi:ubiquinone/menaquinone biosynthesis C-methylase UbiE